MKADELHCNFFIFHDTTLETFEKCRPQAWSVCLTAWLPVAEGAGLFSYYLMEYEIDGLPVMMRLC